MLDSCHLSFDLKGHLKEMFNSINPRLEVKVDSLGGERIHQNSPAR